MFSSREIAVALWLGIGLIWIITKPGVREAIRGVVRALLAWKILASLAFLLAWTILSVWALSLIGFWNTSLLKDTVLWFCFSGFVMLFSSQTNENDENVFRLIVRDSVKIVVVFEFLVGAYTFPLPIELMLVPALTFVGLIHVVAESRKEFAPVAKLTGWIQAIAGLAILGYAARMAAIDLGTLRGLDTTRQILLAPILSILLAPAVYIVLLVSAYETLFLRIRFGHRQDSSLQRTAKRRLLRYLGLSVRKVRGFSRAHAFDLFNATTPEDLELLIARGARDKTDESLNPTMASPAKSP